MSFYRPVVWLGPRGAQVEKLCKALRRYCQQEFGDPSPIVDVIPDEEFPDMLMVVIVVSSGFRNMPISQRQNSILDFLSNDPGVTREDRSGISRIITASE